MDEPYLEPLPRFNTIGLAEKLAVGKAMSAPLSGYLGGIDKAGYWVTRLQETFKETFGVKHAIACNSATSGLLAACMAAKIGPDSLVWITGYSMSATAACAKVLGARIVFIDIETIRFGMSISPLPGPIPKCIIVANLFGHPAYLATMRSWCDCNRVILIEDNAQAAFAKEGKSYAGTVGHMGVFSFNVHKHLQCGEGGVAVTQDSSFSDALNCAINHGELAGQITGLNLRMTEVTGAIACVQMGKAKEIIAGRIALAEELTDMVKGIPWITPPRADIDCIHVYYKWAALITNGRRDEFVDGLRMRGMPIEAGYTKPLHWVFDSGQRLPVVERVEKELINFEICSYDPSKRQRHKMREIFKRVAGSVDALQH